MQYESWNREKILKLTKQLFVVDDDLAEQCTDTIIDLQYDDMTHDDMVDTIDTVLINLIENEASKCMR